MPREALLVRTLVELADTLVDDFDVVELLTRLTDRCVDVLDVAAAGIMLMSGDVPRGSVCTTNAVSALIEELQFELGEGPCVDAYHQERPVLEPDLLTPVTPRWLALTGPAVEAVVRGVFGFRLRNEYRRR